MQMKDFPPLLNFVQVIGKTFGFPKKQLCQIKVQCWEDNEDCLNLVKLPLTRMTPQSKHYATKYHWFRAHLHPNHIEILPIRSEDYVAGVFTKSLHREPKVKMRLKIIGR